MTRRQAPRKPTRLDVYGISVEAWTRRWGVQPFTSPCYECGRPLTTTIPFVVGDLRGLRAPACVCGQDRAPYVVVSASNPTGIPVPFGFV